jgi:hypothetical protein
LRHQLLSEGRMKFILLASLFYAGTVFGVPFGTDWNSLSVTWNLIPFQGFKTMPRLTNDKHEFTFKDNQCTASDAKFRGQRYWSKLDPAVILLFDKNGIIAGMQSSVLKNQFTPSPGMPGFVDDGDYWTQTAYFIDPNTICSPGRTKEEFDRDGTGTGLWLQSGPDPVKDVLSIPLDEQDVKLTLWGHGKCFITMGQHYWYNISEGMSCNTVFPNCLLYNKGKLTGFCFIKNAKLESPRYDYPYPTNEVVKKFLDPVPKCFFTDPSYKTLSTVHVYFHSNPQLTSLC